MADLPMPSDLRKLAGDPHAGALGAAPAPLEPPSVKGVVRLFVIPLFIAIAVIAIMLPFSWLTGGPVSLEQAINRLKAPGGERTFGLVGPGAKERYMDAKSLVDQMKAGLDEPQRIKLAADLRELLAKYIRADEGEIQHFVLLALGRVWQKVPGQPDMNSTQAIASRQATVDVLLHYFDAPEIPARKAAILSIAFWRGQTESLQAIPPLLAKLNNAQDDLDVRMAAAAALGNLASPTDAAVIETMNNAMHDTDPRNAELVWMAASVLAQFNRPEAAPTMLMLLNRAELAQLKVYDRETDPKNPVFRPLTEQEQQRFLINAMERAKYLDVPAVQAQLQSVTKTDPSVRVRTAGIEILGGER